jgi:predicted RNA binding protein YcfA (HicA-like mRNA interferase family)
LNEKSLSRTDGSNLYPKLRRLLLDAGCTLVRQGKGSHEVWLSPLTNRTFTVPRNTVITHTANSALKDAGLPKAF